MLIDDDLILQQVTEIAELMRNVDEAVEAVRVQSATIAQLAADLEAAQQQLAMLVRVAWADAKAARDAAAVPVDRPATASLPQLLTTVEAAAIFSKTTETIRDWVAAGKLDGQRINGYYHVTRESVEALLSRTSG